MPKEFILVCVGLVFLAGQIQLTPLPPPNNLSVIRLTTRG